MKPETPQPIKLSDYRPVPYEIDTVELVFKLQPEATEVQAYFSLRPNPGNWKPGEPLVLDGEKLELLGVALDEKPLTATEYSLSDFALTIFCPPPEPFSLRIVTRCNPADNTELSGLYMSNGMYCTQCEAEGFRRITYFLDRPDVMAKYRVRIEAHKETMPVLLSNGNPVERGEVPGSERHYAVWDDPFPKPSYLFALVAGDLASVRDRFKTMSGREVHLGIYVEKGKEGSCGWAMEALKSSMRWDEEKFGREYDLDVFNIVAVSNFNMGAMENKGLNIFNDKYILALPETATDADYVNIEAIVAHEYFHNWTGNRITCRDWFQLCLKEGLTVFRDQEFTSDMRSRAVKRINDVKTLRARQFPEDDGPLAHPVRPSSYIEINNFYTPTVYEKGAEVCRMMKALIGERAFRKGMDLYFDRHDGQAAIVENFVACMADASGRDFTQFFTWYEQAGTPEVIAEGCYHAEQKVFDLTLEQKTAPTPGQAENKSMQIPLGIGLVGPQGEDMPLDLEGVGHLNAPMIELNEKKKTFRFRNVPNRPMVSLNRGFSAPIKLSIERSPAEQLFLMAHDRDSFNRWEAGQTRGRDLILSAIGEAVDDRELSGFAEALGRILADETADDAFKGLMLGLPSEAEIAATIGKEVDPDVIVAARDTVRAALGRKLESTFDEIWMRTGETGPYSPYPRSAARRTLRYAALQLLMLGNPKKGAKHAISELSQPHSMSAEMGALSALVQIEAEEREAALSQFHSRHSRDPLLIDKWFALHAQARDNSAARKVEQLESHPDFTFTTPNRVYSLLGTFTSTNLSGFHSADGEGYRVVADAIIRVDGKNPQVAARLATGFRSYRLFNAPRREAAEAALGRILEVPSLSKDCYEIVSRIQRA